MIVPKNERLIGFAVGLPIAIFTLWMYFGTYYELRDDHLLCKSGPFSEKIVYEKIRSLKFSRNPASSMALSIDRIEIRQHGKGYITGTTFVSSEDREEFMNDLEIRCKNLERYASE